jgi:hypothetical protein
MRARTEGESGETAEGVATEPEAERPTPGDAPAEPLSRVPVIAVGAVILLISALWLSCHELSHGDGPAEGPQAPDAAAPPVTRTIVRGLEHG